MQTHTKVGHSNFGTPIGFVSHEPPRPIPGAAKTRATVYKFGPDEDSIFRGEWAEKVTHQLYIFCKNRHMFEPFSQSGFSSSFASLCDKGF